VKEKSERKILIFVIAILLGVFIIAQSRGFEIAADSVIREDAGNVFQEIKILKDKNAELKREIDELENTLDQFSDRTLALEAIQVEIDKYYKLTGDYPIFGPGLSLTIDGDLTIPWIIDLVNQLYNSGAEAISINGIRITNQTTGFDNLPKGKILINGSVIYSPYTFDIICEASEVIKILELPGGIFSRLISTFSGITIITESKDQIRME